MLALDSVKNILHCIEAYNCLIKYQVKDASGERKIELPNVDFCPDIEIFKTEILSLLEAGAYSNDFIYSINRIYLLSEANGDLSVEYPGIRKPLALQSPAILDFSLDIFQFLRENIFHAEDECERPVHYKGFDHDALDQYPEYLFREDGYLLFPAYYLLSSAATAYFKQLRSDFENQLSFRQGKDIENYRQSQKERLAEDIAVLSTDFCNREIPFRFIQNQRVDLSGLIGFLLSDVLQKTSVEDYAGYVSFDYRQYPHTFCWEFNRLSISEYPGLSEMYGFERLVKILGYTLLLKELATAGENKNNPEPDKEEKEPDTEPLPKPKPAKTPNPEYLLPVPVLNAIYEQFNGELWVDVTLVDFLNMFTTAVNRQGSFKLKHGQITRFYYLLKKIWFNGNQSLFGSEKEWIVPFLGHYNLSFSAYANQSIKNEGGKKHREFIRSVDKLLPKEGNF